MAAKESKGSQLGKVRAQLALPHARKALLNRNGRALLVVCAQAEAAMIYKCPLCQQQAPNVKVYKVHYDAKHAGEAFPAAAAEELAALEAKKGAAAEAKAAAEAPKAAPKKKAAAEDLSALLSEGLKVTKKK